MKSVPHFNVLKKSCTSIFYVSAVNSYCTYIKVIYISLSTYIHIYIYIYIYNKVPTTDSLVFVLEKICRTAFLFDKNIAISCKWNTKYSEFLSDWFYMFNFYNFIFQKVILKMINVYFLWFGYWTFKEQNTVEVLDHFVSAYYLHKWLVHLYLDVYCCHVNFSWQNS